jgi:hypothetical protein
VRRTPLQFACASLGVTHEDASSYRPGAVVIGNAGFNLPFRVITLFIVGMTLLLLAPSLIRSIG